MKLQTFILIAILGVGGLAAYDHLRSRPEPVAAALEAPPPRRRIVVNANPVEDRSWIKPKDGQAPAASASPYQCDGRTMCSQMRSCAEAEYFIQHCPGTKMDGDGDGVPCEQQWCS
jgi:hypothetical protein